MMHMPIAGIVNNVPLNLWGNIIGAWEFNGDNANTAVGGYLRDETTINHIASYSGSTKSTGVLGDARGMNGVNSNFTVGKSGLPVGMTSATDFTILGWVRPKVGGGHGYGTAWYIGNGSGGATSQLALSKLPDATKLFMYYPDSAQISMNTITPDTWVFFGLSYHHSSTTFRFYTSSGLYHTKVAAMNFSASWRLRFIQNIDGSSGGAAGPIDAIRLFNRQLSQNDILAHYNSGSGLAYS